MTYAPFIIIISILNGIIIQEVLQDKNSTLVYHFFELFADFCVCIGPFMQGVFQLNIMFNNCVWNTNTAPNTSPFYGMHSGNYWLANGPLSLLNNVLPTISNFLLAYDRYRCVKYPIKWKSTYSARSYAFRLIRKTVLLTIACAFGVFGLNMLIALFPVFVYPENNYEFQMYYKNAVGSWAYWQMSYYIAIGNNMLICDIINVVMSIIQARYLFAFWKGLNKPSLATGNANNAEENKRIERLKTARGLVIGTVCAQVIVSLVFSTLSLLAAPQYFIASYFTNGPWTDALYKWMLDSAVIEFGKASRAFARISLMSSNIVTIVVHVVTCPAYRRGAINVARKWTGKNTVVSTSVQPIHIQP
jgi:hypothetical protein